MKNEINTPEFIRMISVRAGFTQGDVLEIYRTMVSLFEESVRDGVELKLKSFGKLYSQPLGERHVSEYTDSKGDLHKAKVHPPTTKVVFRLSENIRQADKKGDD